MFTRTVAFKTTGPRTIRVAVPGTTEHPGNVMHFADDLHVDINKYTFVRMHGTGAVNTMWTPTHVRVRVSEAATIVVGTAPPTTTFREVVDAPFTDAERCGGEIVVPAGDGAFEYEL